MLAAAALGGSAAVKGQLLRELLVESKAYGEGCLLGCSLLFFGWFVHWALWRILGWFHPVRNAGREQGVHWLAVCGCAG